MIGCNPPQWYDQQDALVRAELEPLTEREIGRVLFRTELFQQHGWPEDRAEWWAYRLALRDQQRDDRRLCVECACLLSQWRCRKRLPVIAEVLQRCDGFEWEKPKA